jgi:hypothetical protein
MSEAKYKAKRASGTSGRKQIYVTAKGSRTFIEEGVRTTRGTEVWHVRVDGKSLSLTTSNSSASIMDDAVKIYSPALERLAKR